MKKKATWIECLKRDVPSGARFIVPAALDGQIIEISYATFGALEMGEGDAPFKKVVDRSIGPVPRYYRRG